MRRRYCKSDVKSHGSPVELHTILQYLNIGEVCGILGVAVKCVDIKKNTGGESDTLDEY